MPPAGDSEAAAEVEREGAAGERDKRGLPLLEAALLSEATPEGDKRREPLAKGVAVFIAALADAEEMEEEEGGTVADGVPEGPGGDTLAPTLPVVVGETVGEGVLPAPLLPVGGTIVPEESADGEAAVVAV